MFKKFKQRGFQHTYGFLAQLREAFKFWNDIFRIYKKKI